MLPEVFPLGGSSVLVAHGDTVAHLELGAAAAVATLALPALGSPIVAAAQSLDGGLFATCTQAKELVVWRTAPPPAPWVEVLRVPTPRCASAVTFSPTAAHVVFADKTGDAYAVAVPPPGAAAPAEPPTAGDPILGNISMLLCLAVTPDGKQLIVGNRDEKIRISAFPRAWNIDSYCLGHRAYVTSVVVPPAHPAMVLSGGGDGTVRAWAVADGRLLATVDVAASLAAAARLDVAQCVVRAITVFGSHVVVTIDGLAHLLVLQLHAIGALSVAFVAPVGQTCCTARFDPVSGVLWVLTAGDDAVRAYEVGAGSLQRLPGGAHGALVGSTDSLSTLMAPQTDTGLDGVAIYFSRKEERLRVASDKKSGSKRICVAEGAATAASAEP